jgi:hypothetical protein
MHDLTWCLGALALLCAGCGSKVDVGTGGTGAGGAGAGGAGAGGAGSGLCPAAEPSGGSCAGVPEGFRCTYGDSVRPECRDDWVCSNGQWVTTKGVCVMPPAGDCNFSAPPTGQICATEGGVCTLDTTICICSSCSLGPCMVPPPKWSCAGPPTTPGCPATVPNDGSGCEQEGLMCSYGLICSGSGAQVTCKDGAWLWENAIACPE